MRKLLKRTEAAARGKRHFIRMLPLAALALGGAMALDPQNELCMRPISFGIAQSCPDRRQEYLDSEAHAWRGRCIADIILDDAGEEASRRYRRDLMKHGLKVYDTGLDGALTCESAKAFISMTRELIGRGDRSDVFVCDRLFDGSEAELVRSIAVHEATHACDRRFGIKVGGRVLGHRELADVPDNVARAAAEVRAYGRDMDEDAHPTDEMMFELYAVTLILEESGMPYTEGMYYETYSDRARLLEGVLGRVDMPGSTTQFLARHTLYEHRAQLRRLFREGQRLDERISRAYEGLEGMDRVDL